MSDDRAVRRLGAGGYHAAGRDPHGRLLGAPLGRHGRPRSSGRGSGSTRPAWTAPQGRRPSRHGLRLGPLVLLGMEGEIFVRYQLDLERECGAPLMLCGYANGCIGYVPTADEYERGGYEIDQACKVYPSVRMIAPESERLIRAGAQQLLCEELGIPRR